MKTRRHHNNKGTRQIKNGQLEKRARKLAKEMGVPYETVNPLSPEAIYAPPSRFVKKL